MDTHAPLKTIGIFTHTLTGNYKSVLHSEFDPNAPKIENELAAAGYNGLASLAILASSDLSRAPLCEESVHRILFPLDTLENYDHFHVSAGTVVYVWKFLESPATV